MSIIFSAQLYVALVKSDVAKIPYSRVKMEKIQREAVLRYDSAYHVVVMEAVCLLACTLSL